ncbi:flagellin [Rahnella victoriana]|uniref:flagellin N-terminal helical domain-containing protein n=1 Tax=Rahnella victoriana TaxID=1510570 RepID=UPI001038C275|nr:flagellin [Rahnella victoriana]TBX31520.1 flagellin FliC [Rahnella victoriana]UHM90068.1 flagellin FliC [Rahnella victoriana]
MAQVINTNTLSLMTQNNLNKSQSALSTAIERLSSGLRINSAKDDAAGQAIANRFTSNINGLTQASRNANDGISVAQTTEGSLSEINNNLQRVRELSVQAANGTNSDSDLKSIQDEITSRLSEIDRVSGQTQFNGVKVLASNQTMSIQVGANDGQTIDIDLQKIDSSTLGLSGFSVQSPTTLTTGTAITTLGTAGSTVAINDAAIATSVAAFATTGTNSYTLSKDDAGNVFATVTGTTSDDGVYSVALAANATAGTARVATLGTIGATPGAGNTTITAATAAVEDSTAPATGATVSIGTDTNTASITGAALYKLQDADGKDTGVYALKGTDGKLYAANVDATTGDVSVKTATYKDSTGTSQTAKVELGGLDGKTEVVTVGTGSDAKVYKSADLSGADLSKDTLTAVPTAKTTDPLEAIDAAISKVDDFRSSLGAIQNRFDSAITNLANTTTNLQSAQSRIQDADYATEVSAMSKAQILQQAGTSVLSKANQVPQSVLSLLQ